MKIEDCSPWLRMREALLLMLLLSPCKPRSGGEIAMMQAGVQWVEFRPYVGGSSNSSSGGQLILTSLRCAGLAFAAGCEGCVVETHEMMVERGLPAEGSGAMGVVTAVGLLVTVDAEMAFEVVLAVEALLAARVGAGVHDAHGEAGIEGRGGRRGGAR